MVTTMKVSATTKSAADPQNLASDFVQECLGFHTTTQQQSKKLDALWNIRSSLQSCFVGGAANVDDVATTSTAVATSAAADNDDVEEASHQRLRQEWRIFLEGHSTTAGDDDEDDGFNDASDENGDSSDNFMLRDSLIQCLGESCCHPPPPNSGDDNDTTVNDASEQENENLNLDVMESSLCCLTHLVRLRCDDATDAATNRLTRSNEKKKKKLSSASSKSPAVAPIFGHAFVTIIAANVVEALQLEDDGDSSAPSSGCSSSSSGGGCVPHAASQLLIALLRCDRPRNEMCPPTIRDLILLPACNRAAETSSTVVAHIAQILSTSIISGVEKSVTVKKSMDEEELSMRRETAALNQLQDMRDVVMSVGLVCSQGLGQEEKDADIGHCTKQILHALQEIHDIAAFAVESQLETLLGDERAMPILARLRSNQAEDNIVGAAAPATGGGGGSSNGGTMDDEITEDGKESKLEELTTLAPIYANIAKPPIFLTTLKQLETMLLSITDKLNATHASLWDARLNALIDLECILAGGVASMSYEARYLFVDKLRKMPLQDQFQDLRSQITQQVCRVMVATSYEYLAHVSNDAQLNQSLSHLVECLIFPAILNLCKSGTRLMATQGMHCLLCLNAVCGRIGYPRTVPRYCEEILGDGKVHKNRKRGSVMALTVALRVWDTNCFVARNNLDQLAKATKEAATNRDPAVREEGRKLYWAMHACCDETSSAVAGMFDERSREMKNLKKEQDGIDSEWEEVVGVMSILVETGVLGQASKEENAAKKGTKKQLQKSSSRVPPPSGRSSIKRPAAASVRLRAEHGTPFKTQRVISTPIKVAASGGGGAVAASSTKKLRPPSSATGTRRTSQLSTPSSTIKSSGTSFNNRNSSHDVISSSSKIPRAGPSTTIAASTTSDVVVAPPRSAMKGMNSSVVRLPRREGKENSSSTTAAAAAIMKTPMKSVGFNVNHLNSTSPVIMGTPIVNLLARASPLSAEKVRSTGDVLGTILSMLSDTYSPHEQSLGIKALALFAKEEPRHGSWEEKFSLVLECLLDQIKSMPTAVFEEPVDFIRSPSKKSLSSCHQMQHLFLQGVRSLLQFISGYVKSDQVKDIVCSMLECTNDAPFEIVHTAERALHNLVTNTNPETCFEHLLPFTCVEIDLNDKSNPPALLSTLRTMRYLVDRISIESLKRALPSLLPLFHMALCHKSVDMRKATVFILVEVYFVLGEEDDELELLDEFTDCQRRLVDVYIERHPKNKVQRDNAKAVVPRSNAMSMQPISA
mmetsp:Transcript_34977/g.62962  ORF Transcript_34977/g.62962 Transcript_34977/m.62962 type:complete len:1268 (-) Transcript_34977:173-3976(-)